MWRKWKSRRKTWKRPVRGRVVSLRWYIKKYFPFVKFRHIRTFAFEVRLRAISFVLQFCLYVHFSLLLFFLARCASVRMFNAVCNVHRACGTPNTRNVHKTRWHCDACALNVMAHELIVRKWFLLFHNVASRVTNSLQSTPASSMSIRLT